MAGATIGREKFRTKLDVTITWDKSWGRKTDYRVNAGMTAAAKFMKQQLRDTLTAHTVATQEPPQDPDALTSVPRRLPEEALIGLDIATSIQLSELGLRSQPGDPPFAESFDLANSLFYRRVAEWTFIVGSRLEYGWHLEHGFVNALTGNWVEPRPWLVPTFNRNRRRLMTAFGQGVRAYNATKGKK